MADIVAMHILSSLEKLPHDAADYILAENLLRGHLLCHRWMHWILPCYLVLHLFGCHLSLLLLLLHKFGKATLTCKLQHEVALIYFGIFVKRDELVDQVTIDFLQYVELIDGSLGFVEIRCVTDFDHELPARSRAAI